MTGAPFSVTPDTTVITVNNRLAGELRRRHNATQADAGRVVWPSVDILPISAWLQRSYLRLLDDGFTDADLLDAAQERLLWQQVIEADERGGTLLRGAQAAKEASEAHRLMRQWHLDRDTIASHGGEDTHVFLRWLRRFDHQMSQRGCLSAAELPELIAQAAVSGVIRLPGRLVLAGFTELSPAVSRLVEHLRESGCAVDVMPPPAGQPRLERIEADDPQDEIHRAAHWAAKRLALGDRRIGIVCVDLERRREAVSRLFNTALAPRDWLLAPDRPRPFNLSLGEPLADQPMVSAALSLLQFLVSPLPSASLGRLLRSPFVGGHNSEWPARALLDVALRDEGRPEIGFGHLQWFLAHRDPKSRYACPELEQRLANINRLDLQMSAWRDPGYWSTQFHTVLTAFGWPGDKPLDSDEYQQHEHFLAVLSRLSTLGKVQARMRLNEALQLLRQLCADTVYQAESPPAAVQILGLLEAADLTFDAVWLLGIDDQTWPQSARPHPLLPAVLQKEQGLPHASPEKELAFAENTLLRVVGGAGLVVASSARADGDHELRPSPLIAAWPLKSETDRHADRLRAACRGDGPAGVRAKAWVRPPAGGLRGGSGLIAAQSACPFSAVARYRLGAEPLPEPTHAPDAATTGRLVHDLMQRIWQRLQTSTQLAEIDDDALSALLRPLAEQTVTAMARQRPDLYGAHFARLEADRLARLAVAWLHCERQREQAFVVEALERDETITIGPLSLRTRADRVDRLDDGRLAIIDYKTGRVARPLGWIEPRIEAPQLPLYAIGSGAPVAATVLAQLRLGLDGCHFLGVAEDERFAPGVDTAGSLLPDHSWEALLQDWRTAINDIAAEIQRGRAEPTPSLQACRYCPFAALCRVGEAGEDEA